MWLPSSTKNATTRKDDSAFVTNAMFFVVCKIIDRKMEFVIQLSFHMYFLFGFFNQVFFFTNLNTKDIEEPLAQ